MYIFIFISDGLEFTTENRLASNSLCLHCVTLAGLELRDPPPASHQSPHSFLYMSFLFEKSVQIVGVLRLSGAGKKNLNLFLILSHSNQLNL